MNEGDRVVERFEIERRIASGGMGHVFRARDQASGEIVALKLLHAEATGEQIRFTREAEALAALRHPGIVRYVAHGLTAAGAPFLAMEWLEGETLAERLERGKLSLGDVVDLASAVAAALAAVHALGFVHRDLKPSNIFLPGGAPSAAKLIDFGIARLSTAARDLTLPGTVLGTVGYLAPEQARGGEVDARADVFALGCVLFKCVVGVGAFGGEDDLSVLLKILVDDPPRLRELRPGVPAALDDLVARMLAKAPWARPADGAALVAELGALGSAATAPPTVRSRRTGSGRRPELTGSERRVLSLVLTREAPRDRETTLSPSEDGERSQRLRDVVERHGGQLELLADRSSIAVFSSAGEPTELAARAAHCALTLRALHPDVPAVVVSGRGEPSQHRLVGELIDRAVTLVQSLGPAPAAVRIDPVTAGLLGSGFEVEIETSGAWLRGERETLEATRTLLGRPTLCVGRERELDLLEGAVARCLEEPAATAVLVTAAAGMGKSRLCSELLTRVARREEPVEIWIGRGDPMSAGSPFGLVGKALRRALGLVEGAPLEARREKLRERVARRERRPAEAARVTEFLGELVGTPFPEEDRVQLRAARRDPVLLGDQMRRAFEDFVRAECGARPVLLVLEDLHWGDLPSIKLVDAALRHLETRPFMVLAVGRPELHELFPNLWAGRGLHEIHLGRLPRRAGERLVRDVLGEAATEALIQSLLERADGNVFYLEELIRAASEGQIGAMPETVLAMVQARLQALDAEERRILRAASVFGRTFWEGAVSALLGGARVHDWLRLLTERELIAPSDEGMFRGEQEYRFHHALVHEAAYAMLTDVDRAVGHRLAGEWLEHAGERDAMMLAEHFERGAEPVRAAGWYRRAAEQAFEGNDLEGALVRAQRALVCADDPEGPLTGELRLLEAKAGRWLGRNREAEQSGLEAMRLLPRGGARWCEAAAEVVRLAGALGHVERLLESTDALLDLAPFGVGRGAEASYAIALARAAMTLQLSAGRQALAEVLLARAEEAAPWAGGDPAVDGQVLWARSLRVLAAGNVTGFLELVQASRASLSLAGDLRSDCIQALNAGHGYLELGAHEEAARILDEARRGAERMGLGGARSYAGLNLGLALLGQGRIDEARTTAEEALAEFRAQADRPMEAIARTYLAMILARGGDREAAAVEALAVAGDGGTTPAVRAYARALVADVRLAEARSAEALAEARTAMEILGGLEGIEEGEALIRVVHAEALAATGDGDGARAAIGEARDRLLARAARVVDPALRESLLSRVPENARTLALARAWLEG